jgi:sulfane dehydrogenase subunit SoxC
VDSQSRASGRLIKAPENFLAPTGVRQVLAQAREGRRDFIRMAFAAAGAAVAAPVAVAAANPASSAGDPAILDLPEHSKGLGRPVATDGYGKPSKYEANVQRRQSPGLTQTAQASVSFAPLQSLFGIVTPSGLHFERHHQGWWDVDPSKHRLMVNGSDERIVKTAKVFTMDELMRLPSVSRFHFIECGANTGMEWGNVAVPTCQYTHGMLSCSEFTGVPLKLLLDMAGVDYKRGRFVLGEGADGSSMTRTVPMELVESGEVIVAYGQNGEMLRPENGYPLRLVVPGVQGVSWVKYLRRIEVGDKPYGAKDEVMHYLDLRPGGLHRQYTRSCWTRASTTSPAWHGRAAERSSASTSRSMAGATGAPRGSRRRCWPSASPGSASTGCGTASRRWSRAGPWTRPGMCSRATSSCAWFAARARSITTTPSRPGWCRKVAR